jgi:Ca-activated chloride channel family protein
VRDIIPAKLPDLFEGDQLVLLGKYVGEEPVTFRLSGNYMGRRRTFRFTFGFDGATTRNSFVPRLWASRKIAVLVDAVRQRGADGGPTGAAARTDPKTKELVDGIVRLSTEFGVLTEYTAFLAREGTDLSKRDAVLAQAVGNFRSRAMATRSGIGAVNQSLNNTYQRSQSQLNLPNAFYDENMNRVSITGVRQVSDRAFYRRGGRWVDSRLVEEEKRTRLKKVVRFGSEEFRRLAQRLASEGRQGAISFRGEILLQIDGEAVLVRGPSSGGTTAKGGR